MLEKHRPIRQGRVSGTPPGVLQTHETDRDLRVEINNGTHWVQPSASLGQHLSIPLRLRSVMEPFFGEFDPGSG